jgi:hypothetical protein
MGENRIKHKPGRSESTGHKAMDCRKESVLVRRRSADPTTVPGSVHDTLRSSGQTLHPATRALMEARFGHDFGEVRIHTDAPAAESAAAVESLAYTVGHDVVFGVGQYAPETTAGQRLIAHELAHVIQQESAGPIGEGDNLSITDPAGPEERAADKAADHALSGGAGGITAGHPAANGVSRAVLQRQPQQQPTGPQPGPAPDLTIAPPGVIPNGGAVGIPHSTDTINVQWTAANVGAAASRAFGDKLQVFKVSDETNQCPGSDADLGDPVYDSDNDQNANVQEGPIPAGQVSQQLMSVTVGPFPSGSYRFTVTVNADQAESNETNSANNTTFNCIDIQP